MTERRYTFILFFIGIYTVIVLCITFQLINSNFHEIIKNDTDVVYINGNTYRIIKQRSKLRWCQPMKFLSNTTGHPVTALVSFPGSGNTWLRYLLQQATGILTGSVYKDHGLFWNGFHGESIANESVSVIKTHEWGPSVRGSFDQAIILIRSPGPAIQAEFNRRSGGHLGHASAERFMRNDGRDWLRFVKTKLQVWKDMNLDWIRNFKGPMLIVHYEDLMKQPNKVMETIIQFLGYSINKHHLRCMMRRKEGIYRRQKNYLPFDPITPTIKIILKQQQDEILKAVTERLESSKFDILKFKNTL